MTIILTIILFLGPVAIVYCVITGIKHTIITTNTRKRKIPTALIASMWAVNGPDRKYGIK